MWSIRNHRTGEVIELTRDVCTEHPEWVHQQCGTESESELQHMLDQMSSEDYAAGQDDCGIGFLADPVATSQETTVTPEMAAEWLEADSPVRATADPDTIRAWYGSNPSFAEWLAANGGPRDGSR